MSTNERLRGLVEPIVASLDLDLYDLDFNGGTLVITVDRAAGGSEPGAGIDVEALTAVTRAVSRALDEADPIASSYALEVSSPGLERALRTPEHHRRAVGSLVSVKTRPGVEGARRVKGVLVRASDEPHGDLDLRLDDGTVRTIAYDDVEKARTVFEWGGAPKPGAKVGAGTDPKAGAKPGRKAAKKTGPKSQKSGEKPKHAGNAAGGKPAVTSEGTSPADKKVNAS